MKRIFLLLILLLYKPCVNSAASLYFEVDGFRYQTTDAVNSVSIKGSVEDISGDLEIPDYVFYNGKKYRVTEIDPRAFQGCYELKNVTIPNTVKTIWYGAFNGCWELEKVMIPENVQLIYGKAFADCTALKEVIISDSENVLTFNDNDVFADSPIEKFYLGRNIKTHKPLFFEGLLKLEILEIGSQVSSLGNEFSSFKKIKNLSILDSDKKLTINNTSFDGYSVERLYLGRPLSELPTKWRTTMQTLEIGGGLSEIPEGFFYECNSLNELIVYDGVALIGDAAFYRCINLSELEISNSVTYIGESAFSYCKNLTKLTIPYSVISIGEMAFKGCTNLQELIITDGIEDVNIANSCFTNCNIINLYIGRNIKNEIGIRISNLLSSLVIGKDVTDMSKVMFDFSNIESVTSMCDIPPIISEKTFNEQTYNNSTLHIPYGSTLLYMSDPYWKKFIKVQDDAAVGIDFIKLNGDEKFMNKKVYTIGGIICNSDSESELKPGIYIIKGKKVLVR